LSSIAAFHSLCSLDLGVSKRFSIAAETLFMMLVKTFVPENWSLGLGFMAKKVYVNKKKN
jgi:hypothetical protein